MYKIKSIPEDFIVEEIAYHTISEGGNFALVSMKKVNYDTVRAIQHIANALKIPPKFIGFAGNKDKRAVTTQFISIMDVSSEKIKKINLKDIKLDYIGQIDERINLGDLKGNRFKIIIRDVSEDFLSDDIDLSKIPNYFGEQRFSTNNSLIGKYILTSKFKDAVFLIREGRENDLSIIKEHLKNNPNDYVGAIRKFPKTIQKFYVHAFQSDLWNKAVDRYLENNPDTNNFDFPIIGFDSEFNDHKIEEIYDEILNEENMNLRSFIVRQIPELSVDGTVRKIFLEPHDFELKEFVDDKNKNKKKIILNFWLEKSCYATTLIKHIFSSKNFND
ncbi:MAG: tRNA pseudouridine(13) synthase TruD [Candidatus Woesearchaeota archaeon]